MHRNGREYGRRQNCFQIKLLLSADYRGFMSISMALTVACRQCDPSHLRLKPPLTVPPLCQHRLTKVGVDLGKSILSVGSSRRG